MKEQKQLAPAATKAAKAIVKLIEDMMPANYGISVEERDRVAEIVQGAIDECLPTKNSPK